MGNPFFEHPILNSPYAYPTRHWELDATGQPTQKVIDSRRPADFVTPIPKPQRQHGQASLDLDTETGLSGENQQYAQAAIIRQVREQVDRWRQLPEAQWRVTPETARLLRHWRHHPFTNLRPFFCQIEAAETAIWLTEVAPEIGKAGSAILEHMANANRDANEEPRLNLFGQLKRITRQWLDTCLVCKGGTYPAQLMYQELADEACNRITRGITKDELKKGRPVKAILDPYNPEGSTAHVNFTTTRIERWETRADRCHVNWVILDSTWEGEFCRVAEDHPQVLAYVKNRGLGLEVPYRHGSEMHTYIPDYIVQVDDGHGADDPLNLIVEVKGYRGEDAKEKAATMRTYWIPGVNHLGTHGRWAFAEFTDVWAMQEDFARVVADAFNGMIDTASEHPTQEPTA